ncbi:MAG: hypothetical protein PUB52_10960 [Lachnospiraceae bacterium]|nr:hypothetical protein [Lachnospiraceae bacterium]
MKKRFCKVVASAALLSMMAVIAVGCGKKDAPVPEENPTPTQTQTAEDSQVTEETESQEESAGEVFEVEIETIDGSRRDDEGNLLASIYMQYPVVKGDTDAVDAINAYYDRLQVEYSPLNSAVLEDLDQALAYSDDMSEFPYEDYTACTVSRNDGEYFCVMNQYVWYAGGVMNSGMMGDVFDSATGKKLTVVDLYPDMSEEEVQEMLLGICEQEINKNPDEYFQESDFGYSSMEIISQYNVEELNFYMYDGKIVLSFGPYEIGYGGWYREIEIGTY